MDKVKKRLDRILNRTDTVEGRVFGAFLALVVLIVCGLFVADTYVTNTATHEWIHSCERVISLLFLIEYMLRWWTFGFSWRYPFTPMALVDLLAISPLFLTFTHFQFLRIVRLARVLRLVRLFQDRQFFFGRLDDLHFRVVRILFTLFCLVFISAGVIYDIEHRTHPEVIGTFFDAVYFAIVTMTTVGFGDIAPISTMGRAATLLMILSGVLLIPWQLTSLAQYIIVSSTKRDVLCQKCGLKFHDPDAVHCKMCGEHIYQEYEGLPRARFR